MAGNRIKGITIEIDGDTSKLTDSLKKVDGQLKTTQSNLRDITRLLKLDPGNTDLLTQKQKNLKDAIQNTKDRLTELKKVQQDSVTPEEWDAVQREIVETEQKLESLKKQYSDFGSVAGQKIKVAGQKIQDFGSSIQKVGKKIMPLSLGVTAIGTAAIGAAKELDNGYDTIITKTGATGKTLEGLQDQMDRVFATLPTDAEAAGTAIGEVNTRFGLTGDILGDVSAEFVRFAEINDTDLNSAIDSVDSIMEKFGVDTNQTGNVLGLMTDAGQRTGISMDTLEATLGKNGATLKEMGLGLTESVNLLANFEANGVDSSTAITALKKAQQNATKSGKTMNSALKDGVNKIKNASTETEALNTATELFGAKGAAEMTQAIREGRLSLDDLSASLGDYSDTVKNTYNETLDPWDQMKVAINNLMLAGNDLAQELFKTLAPIIEEVVKKVKEFTEWFRNLSDEQKETIVKIGLIVAAAGPLLVIFGKAISGIGGVVSAFGSLVGAAPAVATALGGLGVSFGPLLVGGAVIAGVIAGTVLIVKNWDKIKAGAKLLGDNIKKSFSDMKKGISDTWNKAKTLTSNAWNGIKTSISGAVSNVKSAVSGAWNTIKSTTSTVWNNVKSTVTTAANNLKTSAGNSISGLKTTVSGAWDSIKTNASTAWDNVKSTITGKLESAKSSVSNIMNNMRNTISGAFNSLSRMIGNPFKNLVSAASGAIQRIRNIFSGVRLSLPRIKMPHFDVSWRELGPVRLPKISVRWYKKAYENAVMFSQPTVMQTAAGPKGFGDGSGPEIVMGLNKLRELVGSTSTGNTINIYATPGMNVNQLADAVQARLAALERQKMRAWA